MPTASPPAAPVGAGVDHPSLVPALLLADAPALPGPGRAASRQVRRSLRDWLVDTALFLVAVLFGLLFVADASAGSQGSQSELLVRSPPPDGLLFWDLVVGSIGCLALWWRRRWPVAIALLLAAMGTFSDMAGIAILASLFTVAVHRRGPAVVLVTAANVAAFGVYLVVRPVVDMPRPVFATLGLVLTAAVVAWGMFVRARRQLVWSLRDRANRAEAEQQLRVAQAQQLERTRIAREMHDVLAHRLSLLSMHAGALEFRPGAPPPEVARAAGVIRSSAHAALEELREVIGVLREGVDGATPARPQPTLAELPALLAESREAGLRVRAECRVGDLHAVPAGTGRSAYRVVQEALTNVRKHAPGAVASVAVSGGPGAGLTIEVRNPAGLRASPADEVPGAGTGLVGLRERVALAGGHLEHGWLPDDEFRLRAWLPWPAAAGPA